MTKALTEQERAQRAFEENLAVAKVAHPGLGAGGDLAKNRTLDEIVDSDKAGKLAKTGWTDEARAAAAQARAAQAAHRSSAEVSDPGGMHSNFADRYGEAADKIEGGDLRGGRRLIRETDQGVRINGMGTRYSPVHAKIDAGNLVKVGTRLDKILRKGKSVAHPELGKVGWTDAAREAAREARAARKNEKNQLLAAHEKEASDRDAKFDPQSWGFAGRRLTFTRNGVASHTNRGVLVTTRTSPGNYEHSWNSGSGPYHTLDEIVDGKV